MVPCVQYLSRMEDHEVWPKHNVEVMRFIKNLSILGDQRIYFNCWNRFVVVLHPYGAFPTDNIVSGHGLIVEYGFLLDHLCQQCTFERCFGIVVLGTINITAHGPHTISECYAFR